MLLGFFPFASNLKIKQNNGRTKPLIYSHFTKVKNLNPRKIRTDGISNLMEAFSTPG